MGHSTRITFFCDAIREEVRPYVPEKLPFEVFSSLKIFPIRRHIVSPIKPFPSTLDRFQHVHVDLVVPVPLTNGFTVDMHRPLHPVAIPLSDMSAETVANSFIAKWVSRFGIPSILTTDQGRQFHSVILSST
ncbi:integrase catalytic domain-containing protein [Nephila pilipes]|uniref:Integrase catalytic domain-containing protein n=1 Tax=Nephila pilipes TaxID=299642 RepID=A0A8X6Q5A7_NEPPI|nr:integrase catalytic domain-containing protein [Nephila pilipes]